MKALELYGNGLVKIGAKDFWVRSRTGVTALTAEGMKTVYGYTNTRGKMKGITTREDWEAAKALIPEGDRIISIAGLTPVGCVKVRHEIFDPAQQDAWVEHFLGEVSLTEAEQAMRPRPRKTPVYVIHGAIPIQDRGGLAQGQECHQWKTIPSAETIEERNAWNRMPVHEATIVSTGAYAEVSEDDRAFAEEFRTAEAAFAKKMALDRKAARIEALKKLVG